MVKATSELKLKNHITPKAGRLNQVLKTKFGVSLEDFTSAMMGNVDDAKKIGELARQGRLSTELAPTLAAAYNEIINGSTAYNKAISEVLINAGKSAIEIDKVAMNATLANTHYAHRRSELASEFLNARKAETQRHKYQMNHQQIKGYIDVYLAGVDQKASLLDQSNRPEIKQLAADEAYETKVINEHLVRGEKARTDLITQKDYRTTNFKELLVSKFTTVKSALGL